MIACGVVTIKIRCQQLIYRIKNLIILVAGCNLTITVCGSHVAKKSCQTIVDLVKKGHSAMQARVCRFTIR